VQPPIEQIREEGGDADYGDLATPAGTTRTRIHSPIFSVGSRADHKF